VAKALAGPGRARLAEDDDDGTPLGFAMADAAQGTLFALFVRPERGVAPRQRRGRREIR
jgi:hypothetical protein